MTAKNIVLIGYKPSALRDYANIDYFQYKDHISLDDYKTVILLPNLLEQIDLTTCHKTNGRPEIRGEESRLLSADIKYWSKEIERSLSYKKYIYFITTNIEKFCLTKDRSSIIYDSMCILPWNIYPEHTQGKVMIPNQKYNSIADLLNAFDGRISYKYIYPNFSGTMLIRQPEGNNVIGGMMQYEDSRVIFLPDFHSVCMNKDSLNTFIHKLKAINKDINKNEEATEYPNWLTHKSYPIPEYIKLEKNKKKQLDVIHKLEADIVKLEEKMIEAAGAHKLLFETGTELENIVIKTMRLLGFNADKEVSAHEEYDIVFKYKKNILIGECEGKDKTEIKKEKIAQLFINIGQYISENNNIPRGVLFGNGKRLIDINNRRNQFSKRCHELANTFNLKLVETSTLFPIYIYLKESNDEMFKEECRNLFLSPEGGLITFPSPPKQK